MLSAELVRSVLDSAPDAMIIIDDRGRIRITDPEIERFLQQQKASLPQQAQIELAQILIPLSESASAEQVAQAERQARDWRAEIERGADFYAVAQQRSQSLDRAQGLRNVFSVLDGQAMPDGHQSGTV